MYIKKIIEALIISTLTVGLLILDIKIEFFPDSFFCFSDGRPSVNLSFGFILGLWIIFFIACAITSCFISPYFEKLWKKVENGLLGKKIKS